jgi:hypothetical protein
MHPQEKPWIQAANQAAPIAKHAAHLSIIIILCMDSAQEPPGRGILRVLPNLRNKQISAS